MSFKKFLKHKVVNFKWVSKDRSFMVRLEFPDMTENDFSQWSDWGMMYQVSVDPNQLIKISYQSLISPDVTSEPLDQNLVYLNSPASAKERNQFPYYLKVNDPHRDVTFELFMDGNGIVCKILANIKIADSFEQTDCTLVGS